MSCENHLRILFTPYPIHSDLGVILPLFDFNGFLIIGNTTLRSCHKLRHSYQCIIERSRLVEQLAHHILYDTKYYSSTHIVEKDRK